MHDSTKALLDHADEACEGALCKGPLREAVECVMACVRDAQAALRETQDRARAMVSDEEDRTLRASLEPYAQASRGLDRELESFAGAAIRLGDLIAEFHIMHHTTQSEIEAGLSDATRRVDLGTYQLDAEQMEAEPEKVADDVAEEVHQRMTAYLAKRAGEE